MKLSLLDGFFISTALLVAAVLPSAATPYASSITNTGTTLSFRLNESADSVRIISNGGATTNDLGARPAGLTVTNLAVVGDYEIHVSKDPGYGYLQGIATQITSDTNRAVRFSAPRGVAVNRNPASPFFGRIYVSNADTGSVAAVSRNLVNGDGIFLLNSDFTDAVGQGDNARTAGINWRTILTDTGNKPWRLEVGEDDNLYISDYTGTTNVPFTGNLYVADPNVSTNSGTNVFATNGPSFGRIPSSAIVKGSLAGGDLTVYAIQPDRNWNYESFGVPGTSYSVMQRWNIGAGPLPSPVDSVRVTDLPILIADVPSVLSDIDIAPDGKYFITQNRSAGFEAGLYIVDPSKDADGSGFPDVVFDSYFWSTVLLGGTNDILFQTRAVKVAPDGSVVALIRDDNRVWIIPLTNGIPDLSNRALMDTGVTTILGRDLSFDAAGNLYIVSSGQTALKSFSPGFGSRAVTTSDGTFSVTRFTNDPPLITITSTDTNLYERIPGDTGNFTVNRLGVLNTPLTVNLSYSGTAVPENDFVGLPGSITIPAGRISVTLSNVVPIDNGQLDGARSIIVNVEPGAGYAVATNGSVTLQIRDDEQAGGPLLFSDDFDTDTSANYGVQFGAENGIDDKTVLFNYDYSLDGIPAAPKSTGGTTRGLKLTVNKTDATAAGSAGVNLYPLSLNLANDFVLRFDMFLRYSSVAAGTTEHAIFGVNHSGTRTNRALTGGGLAGGDGNWVAIETDGSGSSSGRSYAIFGSTNDTVAPPFSAVSAASFTRFFTAPPFLAAGAPSGQWSDVELIHTNRNLTLRVNNVTILSRTNNTAFTSGTIMLGFMDSFASVGSTNNYVVYDNVRVINLTTTRPSITAVRRAGATIEIDFTADPASAAGDFTLQSTTALPGGFASDPSATITALGGGLFRAVSPNSTDPQRFYRIVK